jgi:hypothetical protein
MPGSRPAGPPLAAWPAGPRPLAPRAVLHQLLTDGFGGLLRAPPGPVSDRLEELWSRVGRTPGQLGAPGQVRPAHGS